MRAELLTKVAHRARIRLRRPETRGVRSRAPTVERAARFAMTPGSVRGEPPQSRFECQVMSLDLILRNVHGARSDRVESLYVGPRQSERSRGEPRCRSGVPGAMGCLGLGHGHGSWKDSDESCVERSWWCRCAWDATEASPTSTTCNLDIVQQKRGDTTLRCSLKGAWLAKVVAEVTNTSSNRSPSATISLSWCTGRFYSRSTRPSIAFRQSMR